MKTQMREQNKRIIALTAIIAQMAPRSKRKVKLISTSEDQSSTSAHFGRAQGKGSKPTRVASAKRAKIHENRFDSENEKLMSTNNATPVLINKTEGGKIVVFTTNQRDPSLSTSFDATSDLLFLTQSSSIDESITSSAKPVMEEPMTSRELERSLLASLIAGSKDILSIQLIFKSLLCLSTSDFFQESDLLSKSSWGSLNPVEEEFWRQIKTPSTAPINLKTRRSAWRRRSRGPRGRGHLERERKEAFVFIIFGFFIAFRIFEDSMNKNDIDMS